MSGISQVRSFSVRSSEQLIESCMIQERIPHRVLQNLYANSLTEQAISLLKTDRMSSLEGDASKISCPEYEMIMKFADELGFSPQEKVFIQLHIIGGQKMVVIGDSHGNEKFTELLRKIIANRTIPLFIESICRDVESEAGYSSNFVGDATISIFGLEGRGKSLMTSAWIYSTLNPSKFPENPQRVGDITSVSTSQKAFFSPTSKVESFLNELHFNCCWDPVIPMALKNMPSPASKALLADILEVIGTDGYNVKRKTAELYPKLIAAHDNVQTWSDLFLGLARICLKTQEVGSCFTATEKTVIAKFLDNPTDPAAFYLFYRAVLTAHRDRDAARALLSIKLPKDKARVAFIGYEHIPGLLAELHQLR
ncbi:MAG: hypothetical protein ACHQT8_04340 [Chlamydiales bacterium]